MKITESQLKKFLMETLDEILFPRGGDIGGPHKTPISDKDIEKYHAGKGQRPPFLPKGDAGDSFSVAREKWLDRLERNFGTRDETELSDFMYSIGNSVKYYELQQEDGLGHEKFYADNIRTQFTKNTFAQTIIGNYNVDINSSEGLNYFIYNIYPILKLDYKETITNKNFGQI
jgi:hypothetical protein